MVPKAYRDNPREYYKKYYNLNKKRIQEKIKKWKAANPDYVKNYQIEYYKLNPEKIDGYKKKFGKEYRKKRFKVKLKKDFEKIRIEKESNSVLFRKNELPIKKNKFDFDWETLTLRK